MKKIPTRNFLLGVTCILSIGMIAGLPSASATTSNTTISSGTLLEYLKTKQTFVGTSFDSSYQRIYDILQKTGMSLLKTVEYQSLVCLGVLPAQSLLSQLQSDKIDTKTSFSKDFVTLEHQLLGIEEKYRLQKENNVDFLNGGGYEEEKQAIKNEIDRIVALHTGIVKNFETSYKSKIMKFVSDYAQYLGQNKELLQTINAKIIKVQYVLNQEVILESGVNAIYLNLKTQDLMSKIPQLQTSLQQVFLGNITPYITTQVKKFKVLTTLSGELETLKESTFNQYLSDTDSYIAKMFSPWFDYLQYQKAKQQIKILRQKYYSGNVLQCTQILSTPATQDVSFTEISRAVASIASGVVASKNSSLKAGALSGLQSFLTTNTSQKVNAFKRATDTIISKISKSKQSSNQNPVNIASGNIQDTPQPKIDLPKGFSFKRPFALNQRQSDVEILQKFLSNQGYYTGTIDSVYTLATKNALYAFQLAQGILKSTDRKDLQGYFGPATRAKVNSLLK